MQIPLSAYLTTSILAGLAGVAAMEFAMWLITRTGWARGNMIVAIGSFLTRSMNNAFRVGLVIHVLLGIGFALLYTFAMMKLGVTHLPKSVGLGLGLGFLQGSVVSLTLVWVVSDQHPLTEFREASFAVGLTHLAGHLAYGATVGLIVGLAGL